VRVVLCAALLLAVAAASCSRDEPRSRIAARVNGEDISIDRLRQALARANSGGALTAAPAPSPGLLMEREIDRELLAQKARRVRLDRDRVVAASFDAATTGILAQAYVDRSLGVPPNDARERAAYYREHPALFAERRVFHVFELVAAVPDPRLAEVRRRAARARGLHEIAKWLGAEGLAYTTGGAAVSSDELEPEQLELLAPMKDGQIVVRQVPAGISIVQLLRSDPAPLSEADAAPVIEALLRARRRAEVAERELRTLRLAAKIEYLMDFEGPNAALGEAR
jgi:EpsD family peptidyl-prolyl cis-trans isomerase